MIGDKSPGFWRSATPDAEGRCASGPKKLSKEFAVTPAYFDFFGEINDEVEREKLKKDIQKWLEIRVPNFGGVLPLTQHLIQYFFATVCYHHDFLDKHIHAECSLRTSAYFDMHSMWMGDGWIER